MQRPFLASVSLCCALSFGAACSSGVESRAGFGPREEKPPSELPQGSADSSASADRPSFGETVSLADKPPPISGGTLAVSRDGKIAVASDPDRDRVVLVDLVEKKVLREIVLDRGDEPGRVIEDDDGRFHVVLREGAAILTITSRVASGPTSERRRATPCPTPRGIALQPASLEGVRPSRLLVACETGELLAFTPAPGLDADAPALVAMLERDLRDVVADARHVFVSTFRSARVIELDGSGEPRGASRIPAPATPMSADQPIVAFRMIAAPPSGASNDVEPVIVHEAAKPGALPSASGTYYSTSGCGPSSHTVTGSVVTPVVTRLASNGGSVYLPGEAVLPVDVALDADHDEVAIIAAGNATIRSLPQLYFMTTTGGDWSSPCGGVTSSSGPGPANVHLTSVAYRRDGQARSVVVQSREPAELVLLPEQTHIALGGVSKRDTGHLVFHSNSGRGASCASCHPEGSDDGRVWTFAPQGPRRTPSLRGTLAGTAPFHWDGDEPDIAQLADDVLNSRMGGPSLDVPQKKALESWLFALPPPKPKVRAGDPGAASGKLVFERKDVGCTNCHGGPRFTNGKNANVGTGGAFQVPSLLGVGARAPLMHDGCASTLKERFSLACGGTKHGATAHLSSKEIEDLTTYLESL